MSTVKVLYMLPDGTEQTMMFGDSYKTWKIQRNEFENNYPKYKDWKRIKTMLSRSRWKGFGGLKWCAEEDFQEELNREGVQNNEPDNPNPRQYSDFVFKEI